MKDSNSKLDSLSNEELEKKKLVSEIKNLNKSVWKQPSFWTFLIVILATIYSWQSGLFETKSKILELKTIQLNLRKDTLNQQIEIIQEQKSDIIKKYDSLTVIVYNLSAENASIKKEVESWKQEKQSKFDLGSEILSFVKELRNLINKDKIEDEQARERYEKNKNWNEYTSYLMRNTLIRNYETNYKTRAIIYREKLIFYLPKVKVDRNSLFEYQYPTNRLGLENITDNLEYMGYKLIE
jgi:hypothetical protein